MGWDERSRGKELGALSTIRSRVPRELEVWWDEGIFQVDCSRTENESGETG